MDSYSPTYIELFDGAGGLSEGFIQAGFTPVAHIEMDKYATLTLKTRIAYHYLSQHNQLNIYYQYLQGKISRQQLYSYIPEIELQTVINKQITSYNITKIFQQIKQYMQQRKIKSIDVISGGAPCQAYSVLGRATDPFNKQYDTKNYLYKFFVQFLYEFKPLFFVFENVPGILSAQKGYIWQDIQKSFAKIGYTIGAKVLCAHDFGVLQNRKRIIIIGCRNTNFQYPIFEKEKDMQKFKVADVLNDLPILQAGDKIYIGQYTQPPSKYLQQYNIRTSKDILTLHITRKINIRDRQIYKLYIETWYTKQKKLLYNEIPVFLRQYKEKTSFQNRYNLVIAEKPYVHTIITHIGHSYIHPDIRQLRSISVRETARLQSFPDNFYFEGPMTSIFRQIGNAVPPLMAKKIGEKIKEMLCAI